MRAVALAACVAAAASIGVPSAQAAAPAGQAKAKVKVTCRWTKATKKSKRRRVCVKVKVKAPAKAKAPAPVVAPVTPAVPALSAVVPTTDPAPVSPVADAGLPAASAPVFARLQVTTQEFLVKLSRPSIVAGPATIQLVNAGEDPHDLHLRPTDGGADLLALPETAPGGVVDRDVTLAAGRYTLYCSLPAHEDLGMRATLTVR
jgi:plastocyanin